MYCNNCGKSILDTDKFCPFCGSPIKKKIIIEGNVTPDAAKKRAFILLDDGDYTEASGYFESLLDYEPENPEIYLGQLLCENKKRNIDELIDYYRDKYSNDSFETCHAKISNEYNNHFEEMAEKYYVKDYLDKKQIIDEYKRYDDSYPSRIESIKRNKERIIDEFKNDTLISRIRSFNDDGINKHFDTLINSFDERIKKAKKEEKKTAEKIIDEYPAYIKNTDEKVISMYDSAIAEREKDYQKCVDLLNNEVDITSLKNAKEKLLSLSDYKDSNKYIEEFTNKIKELEEKNRKLEEEKSKKKRVAIISFVSGLIVLFIMYLIYINVIVPSNRYNQAMNCLETEKYDEAIMIFKELGDYKDSSDHLLISTYRKGLKLLSEEKYKEAVDIFEGLGEYEDSKAKLKESKYYYAEVLHKEKKYDESISLLRDIADYSDSSEKVKEVIYDKAVNLRDSMQYDESISLFEELGDYGDATEQKKTTEKEKIANSVSIPNLTGKNLEDAQQILDKIELKCTVSESNEKGKKVGTVVDVSPKSGTVVLKGSSVNITVAKGASEYSNYTGNGNIEVLFQVGVSKSGNNLRVRSAPTTADDNKVEDAKSGSIFNVYEIKTNEGYTWYRVGNRRWIAYDPVWVIRDNTCDQYHGSFEIYNAKIMNDENIGVYSNPTETNYKSWIRSINNGEIIKIYYSFNNGTHVWYKVGMNEWIKDQGGDRVVRID